MKKIILLIGIVLLISGCTELYTQEELSKLGGMEELFCDSQKRFIVLQIVFNTNLTEECRNLDYDIKWDEDVMKYVCMIDRAYKNNTNGVCDRSCIRK